MQAETTQSKETFKHSYESKTSDWSDIIINIKEIAKTLSVAVVPLGSVLGILVWIMSLMISPLNEQLDKMNHRLEKLGTTVQDEFNTIRSEFRVVHSDNSDIRERLKGVETKLEFLQK